MPAVKSVCMCMHQYLYTVVFSGTEHLQVSV